MGDIFCSKGYKKFFDSLQDNIFDAEQMLAKIESSLSFISEECHLGKLDACLEAPKTVYEPDGVNRAVEVFCHENGYENTPVVDEFKTGESGFARITAYPEKGHTWDDDELEAIHFLAQNVFVFTGRARLMGLMQKATLLDNLTGAVNSSGLMRFGTILQNKGELSQYTGAFLNIKNFKYINKTVGARQGDQILKKYSEIMMEFFEPDEVFARLGGDNFMALVKNERLTDFLDLLSNITISVQADDLMNADVPVGSCEAMKSPDIMNADVLGDSVKSYDIITRAGIYPVDSGDTMAEVMNGSTVALNVAKHSVNHDYIWFRPQMLEKIMHDKEISSIYRKALKNEEFVVYYQPKVGLKDHKLCGCEALVRWVRDGKIISPMDFVPVLENEGSICELDFYVLEKVCQDIRKWLDKGITPVRISTNFSKLHLQKNKNLADDILAVVQKYQISSRYLEVELTEMSGYEDYDSLSAFVDRMKKMGIHTSIDDFGTGYSSLNLLKDLNVDVIKLDKSFLNHLDEEGQNDEIVIKNIINMVNELNMRVIAEGVETPEQAHFLKDANCCMAQGFLFDRPLPHDDFEYRLQNQHYHVAK